MMFLGGVLVPVDSLPIGLQIVARALPLTYAVGALRTALSGGSLLQAALDLAALTAFAIVLFVLAVLTLAHRTE